MAVPFVRRGDSGSPAFAHTLLSSGDELSEPLSRKRRFSGRRKTIKAKKVKTQNNAQLDARNSSDASLEDDVQVAEGGVPADSSDDEEDKPDLYAPSGSIRKSAMAKYKIKRKSLKPSTKQTGRTKSASLSPKAIRNLLSSPYRTRTSEKVRFDLENVDKRSPTPVEDDDAESACAHLTDELHSDSDNDDAIYDKINLISESDAEEEDDNVIEDMEAQFLIKHLEECGELPEESAFSDLYNELEESAQFDNTESDLDNFFAIPSTEVDHNVNLTNSESSPILGSAAGASIGELENAVNLLPMPGLRSSGFKLEPLETGLQTPASLPQSIIMRDYDDEETEDEEPKVHSVSGARLQRVAGLTHQVTPSRPRKNSKIKTPKRGSFKISKKSTIMKHDKDGKLIITKRGKVAASGTITPKGVLTCDSARAKPIPLAEPLSRAITQPSSALTSPTLDRAFFPPSQTLQESPFLQTSAASVEAPFVQPEMSLVESPFLTSLQAGPLAEQRAAELFNEIIDN